MCISFVLKFLGSEETLCSALTNSKLHISIQLLSCPKFSQNPETTQLHEEWCESKPRILVPYNCLCTSAVTIHAPNIPPWDNSLSQGDTCYLLCLVFVYNESEGGCYQTGVTESVPLLFWASLLFVAKHTVRITGFMFFVHHPEFKIARKHNVSETGFVSNLRWVQWLMSVLSKGSNKVGVFLPTPEDRNRPSFWNVVFSSYFRIPETGQTPYTQWFRELYTIIITLWILKAHSVFDLLCSGSDSMWHATYRFRSNPFSM
jgi:hypothetical protein